MSRKFLTGLDLNKNQLENARIQNLSTAPANPVAGLFYFDTVASQLKVYDGTAWVALAAGGNVTEAINAAIDALTTSVIEEGTNLYFTDARALSATASAYDAAGSASAAETAANGYTDDLVGDGTVDGTVGNTVTARIATAKSEAISSAGTATTNAINALDTDDIEEGTTNLYYTTSRAKTDAAALLTGATKTNITITGDGTGLTITAENGVADSDTDDLVEGTTNLYFTDERAQDAVGNSVGNGISYNDTTGAISANLGTGLEFNAGAIDVDTDTIATKTYADTVAGTAETDAKTYTDELIGDVTVDGTAGNTVTARIATAVANLVDSAPAALDTLNELAAALNDDASFSSTITTSIGTKVSKAGDTMTGALVLSGAPTLDLHAATKAYVDTEISDAIAAAAPTTKYTVANPELTVTSGSVSWTATHNLGTRDVTVQVYTLDTYEQVEVDVIRNTNSVVLSWAASATVAADAYKVVVIG